MIKVLQANLKRRRVAHDMAYAAARKNDCDILISSEPNKKLVGGNRGWVTDRALDVAVLVLNRAIKFSGVIRKTSYLVLKLEGGLTIFCCYLSPNIRFINYEAKLTEIMRDIGGIQTEYILLGDVNAKAKEWGSPTTDTRGALLTEWVASKQMVIHNDGKTPTCVTANGASYIDVTLSSQGIAPKITEWKVSEEINLSDHKYIFFKIKMKGGRPRQGGQRLVRYLDILKVKEVIAAGHVERKINVAPFTPESLTDFLSWVKDLATKSRSGENKVPYWWNQEIQTLKEECVRARRNLTRACGRDRGERSHLELTQEFKTCKTLLGKAIRKSKKASWKELCQKLEEDVWGDGYRLATRHLRGLRSAYDITDDCKKKIIDQLFPQRRETWQRTEVTDVPPPFTAQELDVAATRMKSGTAPGVDGIPPEVIKEMAKAYPTVILDTMNKLLADQQFPNVWKEGKVVLIPKGEGPQDSETKYRPICLLSTIGKLYETLIRDRLSSFLEENGLLATNQYGFRKGRSTIDAIKRVVDTVPWSSGKWIILLTFDVQNAFNNASWKCIIRKLRERAVPGYLINIVSEYLVGRRIICGNYRREVTAGVPQGSVLGPTLWNALYDDILKLALPQGAKITGYADDIAVTITANAVPELNIKIRAVINRIIKWLGLQKLKRAPSKTEAVVMKGPYKRDDIKIKVQDKEIRITRSLRYLGVTIDTQAYFGEHVKRIVEKAERRTAALTKILPNVGGPSYRKRQVLWGVVQSTLLYAAPIWKKALRVDKYRGMLEQTQRKTLLRVGSAYRTVSASAIQVITGSPPIDLLVEERSRLYAVEPDQRNWAEERERTLNAWQIRWDDNTESAGWTKRIIPDIKRWIQTGHRRTDYYLTQFLSGHGSFRKYTKRIGKSRDENCIYCGELDDPEHTAFLCPRWETVRRSRWEEIAVELTPENIVGKMLDDPKMWDRIAQGLKQIMSQKEEEERSHQRGELEIRQGV